MIKGLSCGLALLFAYATVVQYNDSDPIRWAAFYAVAAVLTGLSVFRPLPWIAPGLLALGAFLSAALMLPGVVEVAAWTGTEEEREVGGLLLVGLWMLVLSFHHRRSANA